MSDIFLHLSRHFAAPPEKVFDAWTGKSWGDWIGPHGVQGEVTEIDAKEGGHYSIIMHQAGKPDIAVGGVYRVVERPRKLVFTWIWQPGTVCGDGIVETLVTLEFKPEDGGTRLTLRHEGFLAQEHCEAHTRGWTGSLENLSRTLSEGSVS